MVLVAGVTYWFIAYGLTEESEYSNEFIGAGSFLVDSVQPGMGQLFANFAYKLSIMSTATNIVMSAMAERVTFALYFGFAALISIAFALPNYWVQSPKGFLHSLGVVDIAGCSVIHLAGGKSHAFFLNLALFSCRHGWIGFHYHVKASNW